MMQQAAPAKTCFKCRRSLPIESFYKHPGMADGRLNKCKGCAKSDVRGNRKANLHYYRAFDRARSSSLDRVASKEAYAKSAKGRAASLRSVRGWAERNPAKRYAEQAVNNEIASGRMKRQPCVRCGDWRAHAHHEDYSFPLRVVWYCPKDHKARHREIRAEHAGHVGPCRCPISTERDE